MIVKVWFKHIKNQIYLLTAQKNVQQKTKIYAADVLTLSHADLGMQLLNFPLVTFVHHLSFVIRYIIIPFPNNTASVISDKLFKPNI